MIFQLPIVCLYHQVTILVNSGEILPDQLSAEINQVTYQVPSSMDPGFRERILVSLLGKGMWSWMKSNQTLTDVIVTLCEVLVSDGKLLESLKTFDLIVADRNLACGALLSATLGIRRVDYGNYRLPHEILPPESIFTFSYVPYVFSQNPSKMRTFFQRLKNVLVFLTFKLLMAKQQINRLEDLQKKYRIKPEKRSYQLVEDVELTLIRADFAVESARPIRPSTVFHTVCLFICLFVPWFSCLILFFRSNLFVSFQIL